MKLKPDDLYASPNKLARHYSKFKVSKRLLFTGHSHQAWPDCGFAGQKKTWEDAAELVDDKWEKAFEKAGEVKQGFLKLLNDKNGFIALASNTHEHLIKFLSALPLKTKPKLISTDGEFHTIRRQLDRLGEEGIEVAKVSSSPVDEVVGKLISKCDEKTSAVIVSSVFFQSGLILPHLHELAEHCYKNNIELLVDTYHHLNVVPFSIKEKNLEKAFVVGGGYKYCQLGEGNCFLRIPKDCELRPVITGWYSEFTALAEQKKSGEVVYGTGGDLFAGATYDPTSHYRASEVFNFFAKMKLTPEFLREVNQHQVSLLMNEFDKLNLNDELITRDRNVDLNNVGGFLVLNSERAGEISTGLSEKGVMTDYRGSSLRFGPAPYLSDTQIIEAINKLSEVVSELK
ncbi:MAG: kynureninase [Ignavibacteriales bacterium]|nr:MAG: kynureninase [Ignavibacteriales bacterium]